METRKRDFGLDLARAAAGILVPSVHFFLGSGFYNEPMAGKSMLLAVMVRMACMTCVPLFMLLTGYLCINRKWERSYYRKLLPVLLVYLLSGAACIAFRALWLGENFTVRGVLKLYTDFGAAPYGWYIEMYIGLFLLSPFFNAAWHNVDGRGRKALALTLLGLTAVPPLVNAIVPVWPDWWEGIYPMTYYAVGAWLREHPIRVKKRWLLLGWAAVAAVAGLWSYLSSRGGVFLHSTAFRWQSILFLTQAVLLFSCLRQCGGERVPAPIRWCVGRLAELSLSIYLLSYIADQLIYPLLNRTVASVHLRIFWMPLTVPAVVLCTWPMAQVLDWVVKGVMRLLPPVKAKAA